MTHHFLATCVQHIVNFVSDVDTEVGENYVTVCDAEVAINEQEICIRLEDVTGLIFIEILNIIYIAGQIDYQCSPVVSIQNLVSIAGTGSGRFGNTGCPVILFPLCIS